MMPSSTYESNHGGFTCDIRAEESVEETSKKSQGIGYLLRFNANHKQASESGERVLFSAFERRSFETFSRGQSGQCSLVTSLFRTEIKQAPQQKQSWLLQPVI